ncbi:unnamed protein product, partial [Protopolystoma xenopodis]
MYFQKIPRFVIFWSSCACSNTTSCDLSSYHTTLNICFTGSDNVADISDTTDLDTIACTVSAAMATAVSAEAAATITDTVEATAAHPQDVFRPPLDVPLEPHFPFSSLPPGSPSYLVSPDVTNTKPPSCLAGSDFDIASPKEDPAFSHLSHPMDQNLGCPHPQHQNRHNLQTYPPSCPSWRSAGVRIICQGPVDRRTAARHLASPIRLKWPPSSNPLCPTDAARRSNLSLSPSLADRGLSSRQRDQRHRLLQRRASDQSIKPAMSATSTVADSECVTVPVMKASVPSSSSGFSTGAHSEMSLGGQAHAMSFVPPGLTGPRAWFL